MRRVSVVGTSGSGKTRFAAELGDRLGVSHIELDAIYHQPNWEPLHEDDFRRAVASAVTGDSWVIDGNYAVARPIVWGRADTVVWLDPSRTVVMFQVITRTLWRGLTRRELWNGNRERLRNVFRRDPMENIIVWAWTTYPDRRRRYADMMQDPQWSHATFVRLRTRAESRGFLAGATSP
jgi:adenylate kinase family enzyme